MASAKKTYLLAPTRDTPPAAAIRLGSLITEPAWPEENILNESILPIPSELGPYTTVKQNVESSHSRSHDTSPGIFAEFLQVIMGLGVDLVGHYKREAEYGLGMMSMETSYFNPSRTYLQKAVQADEVRSALRKRKFLMMKQPVYMITGLKIARGASATSRIMKEKGAYAQLSANLAPVTGGVPVTVGPKLGYEQSRGEKMSFGQSDDFVFAYRLCKIVLKGGIEVKAEMYTKGALYSDEVLVLGQQDDTEYDNLMVEEEDFDGDDPEFDVKEAVDEEDGSAVRVALPQE